MKTEEFKQRLIQEIAKCEKVKGIGQTGDLKAPLIPNQSDIDLFVICSTVPTKEERLELYASLKDAYSRLDMEVANGGIWGYGDIFICNEIDVMPMYYTIDEMEGYLDEVLAGKHIEKEGRFYPIGRLASIESLHILYEEEQAWTRIQEKVKAHPKTLFQAWYQNNINQVLDEEDLSRVVLRKEVLFYHQVLEEALDRLLQALYAVNNCYFPSRKRTEKAIASFDIKPDNCYERLLTIIKNATSADTIEESVKELRAITAEIKLLGDEGKLSIDEVSC
ncbi:DUF4037 domain-containing protein [Anaerosporobacter faecicola]|uniref:DUF4037 domain-containing protein n=1 Tax=Anaerosporobacter faecicola TaxID=2718714 RepID=UPI00143A300B|nr:DUF4037 domain-containing protein [Anaerosporobacter faecicola]